MATTTTDDTRTYRGRSLEELLPQIREELGDDAVITRQREGLAGGVGGFFAKRCVEVEARAGGASAAASATPRVDVRDTDVVPGLDDLLAGAAKDFEPFEPPRAGDDAALAEGLETPAIQAIIDAAKPFATELEAAARAAEVVDAAEAVVAAAAPAPVAPVAPVVPAGPSVVPVPVAPAGADPRERPAAAAKLERELVDRGFSAEAAAEVVAETLTHLAPFGARRGLKRLARTALARRLPLQPPRGTGGRAIAVAGPAGAGKTLAVARLAAAYAAGSDLPVAVVALRPEDGGAELASLLAPHGLRLEAAADAAAARALRVGAGGEAIVLVDTPAIAARDRDGIARLGAELGRAGIDEVHLALPATLGAPQGRELVRAAGALAPAALLLTHADATDCLGAAVELAGAAALPLSWVSGDEALLPANPAALAARLLP